MLKTNTSMSNTIALIGVAVLLVIALGAVAYINSAPAAPHLSPSAGNPVPQSVAPASVSAKLPYTNGVYISDQMLRNWIDDAYDRGQFTLTQKYQKVLDGRYERRVGLPW